MWARRLLARPTSSGATAGGSLITTALDAGPTTGLADSASRTIRRETNRRLIIPPEESPQQIGPTRGSGCYDDSMFDVLADVIQQRRARQRQDDRRSRPQIQLRMIGSRQSKFAYLHTRAERREDFVRAILLSVLKQHKLFTHYSVRRRNYGSCRSLIERR